MKYRVALRKEQGLYRLIAMRDIPRFGVKKGDKGGLVQTLDTLSQDGDCWITKDAKATEKARIYDQALLTDKACMIGDSSIGGGCKITGSAHISDGARVYGLAEVGTVAVLGEDAFVGGLSKVKGNAHIRGNVVVDGDAQVLAGQFTGFCRISTGAVIRRQDHVVAFSNVGSEGGTLTVYKGDDDLWATRGCFTGTLDQFEKAVKVRHPEGGPFQEEYLHLIAAARSILSTSRLFKNEMAKKNQLKKETP